MLDKQGWRLAPAFDVNPNTDKEVHVLNLDEADNRQSLLTVLATADYYRLKATATRRSFRKRGPLSDNGKQPQNASACPPSSAWKWPAPLQRQ